MSLTAAEARSLGAIARQMRALFVGVDKLPEAFEAAENLEARVTAAHEQLRDVEASTARAKAELADAEAQTRQARKKQEDAVAAWKTEERKLASLVAKRGAIETVEQLHAEIATLTVQKSAFTEEIDRLKLKFAS